MGDGNVPSAKNNLQQVTRAMCVCVCDSVWTTDPAVQPRPVHLDEPELESIGFLIEHFLKKCHKFPGPNFRFLPSQNA